MLIGLTCGALTKTPIVGELVIPPTTLDLNFALNKTLPATVTFTRASTGTYFGADGLLKTANNDVARFDHNPVTGESLGLLIEESRTNLLLNSTIDGANLATQNITTTAAARTLSFYGTGTVTLSGTHSATVVGTGAFPTRTTYTYTPTAGTLTLTVSGTVQYAQDELGSFATSFIPTAGTPLTRSADVASMTGTNFSSWFNATEGTFVVGFMSTIRSRVHQIFSAALSSSERISLVGNASNLADLQIVSSGVDTFVGNAPALTAGPYKLALAYLATNSGLSANGSSITPDTAVTLPTGLTQLFLGASNTGTQILNSTIARLIYYNTRLSDSILRRLSA